ERAASLRDQLKKLKMSSGAKQIEKEMWEAAKKLDFERAAALRNQLKALKGNKKDNPGNKDKKKDKGDNKDKGEIERKVKEAKVPAAALATLKKYADGAKITEFAEEVEFGHTFYEGSWKHRSGANMDVLVTQTGDLVEIELQVDIKKVPRAALKMARKVAGKDVELVFEKKTMILYEVKFKKGNSQHELLLTPDGRRVEEEIEKGKPDNEDDEDDDDDEHNMKAKGNDDDDNEDDDEDDKDEDDDDEDDDDEDDDDEDDDDEDDEDDEDDDDEDEDNDDEDADDEEDEDGDDEEDEDADDEEDEDADNEDDDEDDEEDEDDK
ncbi:MAG: UvrB/UvrC motif-containing protein, partial [candidate division Zixibacteria bacterium]